MTTCNLTSRRCGASAVILLLLVSLSQPQHTLAEPNKESTAAYCKDILGKLAGHHVLSEVRDLIQVWAMYSRIFIEADHVVYQNEHEKPEAMNPEDRKRWEGMWKADNKTVQEAKQQRDTYRQLEQDQRKKIDELLVTLKSQGIIPTDSRLELLAPCIAHRLNPKLYADTPVVSFLLQYFKHPKTIQPIVDTLIKCKAIAPCELLVNVDNKDEAQQWAEAVERTNGFVSPLFSANIHEVRGYNRLARLAAGQILVLLQDDFVLGDDNCTWLPDVLSLYEKWPDLGIIGLKGYVWGWPGTSHGDPLFKDKSTNIPFQFVTKVDWAPMSVRRSAFLQVGGIDESTGDRGKCGIMTDWDLCIRMWSAAWKVAFYRVPFRNIDYAGTHEGSAVHKCWGRQSWMAGVTIGRRSHGEVERLASIQAMNDNFELLLPVDANKTEELKKYRGKLRR